MDRSVEAACRSLWRNWPARSAVNRKVGGSSPPRDDEAPGFPPLIICSFKGVCLLAATFHPRVDQGVCSSLDQLCLNCPHFPGQLINCINKRIALDSSVHMKAFHSGAVA